MIDELFKRIVNDKLEPGCDRDELVGHVFNRNTHEHAVKHVAAVTTVTKQEGH